MRNAFYSSVTGHGKRRDITALILETVSLWGKQPYDINNGECQEFAECVLETAASTVHLWETALESKYPCHFFLKFRGKFYDAECSDGVQDWRQLPIFYKYKGAQIMTRKPHIQKWLLERAKQLREATGKNIVVVRDADGDNKGFQFHEMLGEKSYIVASGNGLSSREADAWISGAIYMVNRSTKQ